jgi:methanogenic corrinoid protein MtbC1
MDRMNPENASRAPVPAAGDARHPLDAAAFGPDLGAMGTPARPESGAALHHELSRGERMARMIRTIELDVIPRLALRHREPPGAAPAGAATPAFREADEAGLAALLLLEDEGPWLAAFAQLRARGLSFEALVLEVVTPAVRRLGRMWEADECDFADVTVGVGRMQRALRALAAATPPRRGAPVADGRRVLLWPAPDEQHAIGLVVVAEFFRRAGWEVVEHAESPHADPVQLARQEWFDLVGFSLAAERHLAPLRALIAAMRRQSRNRGIGVLVGGPAFLAQPERVAEVGADVTAPDAPTAVAMAEQLLAGRMDRLRS